MKIACLPFISFLLLISTFTAAQKLADPILLWPEGAPGASGQSDEDKPAVIPFVPDAAKRNGCAVLVVPGGGFTIRAIDHEGVLVAQWLKDHGITAFLLRYRLRPLYSRNDWVNDGQKAMEYIRTHATDYKISADRVGAIGFSAGATLIGDMSLNSMAAKPDFLIMAYGSIRIPAAADSAVVANFPSTFMYGTVEDRSSNTGMQEMYNRLYRAGVPVEAHFFQNGIHGTGLALGDPVLGQWSGLLYNWMQAGGLLTSKTQISLNGVVKMDGAALVKGMLILTPAEDKNAPPVIVYINNTGTGELGRFSMPANQGPVLGKYKVEVRQDATRWISNSRDSFMIKMMDKQRLGTLTEADTKEWGDYLRQRDLSPSIDSQRIYKHRHPADKTDYIITIKEGEEIVVEVFSK
jgi:acetyl esterase/lipase